METRELRRAPSILPLYARAAAPLLPGSSLLPFVGARGKEMPALELALAQVRVDPDKLAAYAHVCGFSLRETLPATYPHVLAFPLHMALMTDRSFPFGAVGLVHVANRIVLRRPIHVEEQLSIRVHATAPREHPRGRTFTLVSQASVDGELVWEDESTMLRRGGGSAKTEGSDEQGTGTSDPPNETTGPREEPSATPPTSAQWHLPGDLGRRYAAVSGDRNPIHMHALSAKALGFKRAIAHGMWTKARCLAALEGALPDAYGVQVRFRRPIELPAKVAFGSVTEGEQIRFAVHDGERQRSHLEGLIEPSETERSGQ
jgi:MaoC like domain